MSQCCMLERMTVSRTSREILDDLLQLKSAITKTLPNCHVIFSQPALRVDNGKTALTLHHLNEHFAELNLDVVNNRNIKVTYIGQKGLRLNSMGKGRLALNLMVFGTLDCTYQALYFSK